MLAIRSGAFFSRRACVQLALVLSVLLVALSTAYATGPSNQVVPNPAPGGTNTLSSVVAVNITDAMGKIVDGGTGTVIDSFTLPNNVSFLCILTADHVASDAGAKSVSFQNVTLGALPPALRTYPIVGKQQVIGDVGQNVDANVVLVRYGTADAFFTGVPDKSIAAASAAGDKIAEVGMGVTGTANFTGPNLTSLTQAASNTFGTKRYQNNLITGFIANNTHGTYKENDVTYTFDAQPGANFVSGEGFGFPGDSGSPLFGNATTFDPGNSLPLVAAVDSIKGIDVFGPTGTINDGAIEKAVDAVYYRTKISDACMAVHSAVPEPSTLALLLAGVCAVLGARHRR